MNETSALIVGLGNPGPEYAAHRHNIGFRVVDALARAHGLHFARRKGTWSLVAQGSLCGQTILLAKPQTFMNLSGKAVSSLSRAHHIPVASILVIHDDLDLPLGRLRVRPEGGSGGHKGVRSTIDLLGTQAFPRVRVGIGRPPGWTDPADYVLQPFAEDEALQVREAVDMAVAAVECWLSSGIVVAMCRYNAPAPGEGACLGGQR